MNLSERVTTTVKGILNRKIRFFEQQLPLEDPGRAQVSLILYKEEKKVAGHQVIHVLPQREC